MQRPTARPPAAAAVSQPGAPRSGAARRGRARAPPSPPPRRASATTRAAPGSARRGRSQSPRGRCRMPRLKRVRGPRRKSGIGWSSGEPTTCPQGSRVPARTRDAAPQRRVRHRGSRPSRGGFAHQQLRGVRRARGSAESAHASRDLEAAHSRERDGQAENAPAEVGMSPPWARPRRSTAARVAGRARRRPPPERRRARGRARARATAATCAASVGIRHKRHTPGARTAPRRRPRGAARRASTRAAPRWVAAATAAKRRHAAAATTAPAGAACGLRRVTP